MFSCQIYEILKNTFFLEHLQWLLCVFFFYTFTIYLNKKQSIEKKYYHMFVNGYLGYPVPGPRPSYPVLGHRPSRNFKLAQTRPT